MLKKVELEWLALLELERPVPAEVLVPVVYGEDIHSHPQTFVA